MKTLALTLLVLIFGTSAWGSLIFDVAPVGGVISGIPGATVGWGFTFTAGDANYYVLTGVEFCIGATPADTGLCNQPSSVGGFTDFAAGVNGLIIGANYAPSPYSETFDNALQKGLGSYAIDPSASPQSLSGQLYVYYDVYDGDPAGTGAQIGAHLSATQPAEVDIVAGLSTPEPGPLFLVLAGLAMVCRRAARGGVVLQLRR